MKLCKILISVLLSFAAGAAVSAADNKSYPIYATDILTTLDGIPIQGYNIGGRTLIILDDLGDYGFTVAYDDSVRTLFVNKTHEPSPDLSPEIESFDSGRIIGNTIETDIEAYVNGSYIQTYVVNGKLAAEIELLGERTLFEDRGATHSKYNMEYVYSDTDRTLAVSTLPSDEPSYEDKLNGALSYIERSDIYTFGSIEKNDDFDIVIFEENNYDDRKLTHMFMLYHNGLYIDMSGILDAVYGFGNFPYLTVFDGQISDDKTEFLFYGEKYRPTGMRSSEFIEAGNYKMDLCSGIVSRVN